MNKVEKISFPLPLKNGCQGELTMLRCSENVTNPKALLDYAVSDLVQGKSYNEFINKNLEFFRKRILIFGINEFNYIPYQAYFPKDTEIFEANLSVLGQSYGKMAILRGGLRSEEPIAFMDCAVEEFCKEMQMDEYVEIFLDNPWVRVLIHESSDMPYKKLI